MLSSAWGAQEPHHSTVQKKEKQKIKSVPREKLQFGIVSRPGAEETPRVKAQQREGNAELGAGAR